MSRMQTRTQMARSVALASFLGLGACPETRSGHAPAACARAYDQCELKTGVLGVCDVVECSVAQPPPCLVCRSQH